MLRCKPKCQATKIQHRYDEQGVHCSNCSAGLISASLQDTAARPKRKHHLELLTMTHWHLLFRVQWKSLHKDRCCGNKASRKEKQTLQTFWLWFGTWSTRLHVSLSSLRWRYEALFREAESESITESHRVPWEPTVSYLDERLTQLRMRLGVRLPDDAGRRTVTVCNPNPHQPPINVCFGSQGPNEIAQHHERNLGKSPSCCNKSEAATPEMWQASPVRWDKGKKRQMEFFGRKCQISQDCPYGPGKAVEYAFLLE